MEPTAKNPDPHHIFIDEVQGHQRRWLKVIQFTSSSTKAAAIMLAAAIVALVIVAIIAALILIILLTPITYSIEVDGRTPYRGAVSYTHLTLPTIA